MAQVTTLICRECGQTYPVSPIYTCEYCFGPLGVAYDTEAQRAAVSRESIAAGPPSIWRYHDLLPVDPPGDVSAQVGYTPLVRADRLAAVLGLGELWIKDDTRNPTNSFKDRVVAVALAKAREFGIKTLACASTGNLANAVAAAAARAGLDSYVFVPADLEFAKIAATAVYGAKVVAVDGNYDDVNRLCIEIAAEQPWGFVNVNLRPFYAEGSKTLAYETAEQLGWETPDHVVVPVASGSLLTKIRAGFNDLYSVGLLDEEPTVRVSGAQAAGCSPVATAFATGADVIQPVKPTTIAKSLAIGNPADGYYALDAVRDTGGGVAGVSDEEIVAGIHLLARTEGIFGETAAGVTVAALKRLAETGVVRADERVVLYVTGHGLKTLDALAGATASTGQSSTGPTAVIAPTLADFTRAFPETQSESNITIGV